MPTNPIKVSTDLWDHQKKCVEEMKGKSYFALFMSPGTGKTRVIIERLRFLFNVTKRVHKVLIICPPIVIQQWRSEFMKYSKIDKDTIVPLIGSGKKRTKIFNDKIATGSKIFITNYESLLMEELFNSFMLWSPEILVLDESHRIKNHAAKRTKLAIRLSKGTQFRYALTGSPILNSIEDIFPQAQYLSPTIFGDNFFVFRNTYMWDANRNMPKHKYFPDYRPRPKAEEAIHRKIAPHSFKAKKEDCLTLPPFIRKRVEVEMSPAQERAYHQMKELFITYINEEAIVAELAITKTLRMRQILSGFAKSDVDHEIPFEENPRLEALSDLLQDIAPFEKVIVWCEFKKNYSQIAGLCMKLKLEYRLLTGEQSPTQKQESVMDFRGINDVRVLIANPGAGGIGVNLVEASHMIYYSRSPNLEHDLQSEARAYRGGSEVHEKITRWDLVVPDTLDDIILDALEKKMAIGDAIVGWAKTASTKKTRA